MSVEQVSFCINPNLTIILETTNEELKHFFEKKFKGLFNGSVDEEKHSTIYLIEKEKLEIADPQILREITIPEICVFNDNDFLIVRNKKKIRVPFSKIGIDKKLEIYFEQGFPKDWLRRFLDDILAFHVVGFDVSLFHGASLINKDLEIIIPAWRGTGKTNLALHLLINKGFSYKGEDQFFISVDKNSFVYTDACHVDYKHMDEFPSLKKKYSSLPFSLRSMIVKIALPFLPPTGEISEFIRRGLIKVFAPKVFVKMEEFIPDFKVSFEQPKKRLVIQLILCPSISDISIRPVELNRLVDRCIGGMQYEREDFYLAYYGWVYATGNRNTIVENIATYERTVLQKALDKANCYEIQIPYGYDWTKNYSKIEKIIENI